MTVENLTDDQLLQLEEIYMHFASVPRLKILLKLNSQDNAEFSAGELALAAGLSQSATSHQLKDLRQAKIIKARKVGQTNLYSLDDHHIIEIIESAVHHIAHENCDE